MRYILALLLLLATLPLYAQQEEDQIDKGLENSVGPWLDKVTNTVFTSVKITTTYKAIDDEKRQLLADFFGASYASDITRRIQNRALKPEAAAAELTEMAVTTGLSEKETAKILKAFINPISMPVVIIWLIVGASIFTIYMGFINVRGFKHAIDVVRGRYDDPNDPGEVSHFQALTAALSGTVGLGNIAGVAIAISLGGPGAMFWMIMAGLLGMSSKFVECTLGTKYRIVHANGSVSGGPMYYLSKGLARKGYVRIGKLLAFLFAIFCVGGSFGGGNMSQINQATQQFINVTGGNASFMEGNRWVFGLFMAIIVGMIIIGGIKTIAKVTDKIVPFMVVVYIAAALVIIFANFKEIPTAFSSIFSGAFDAKALYGGIIGVLIVGFQRAAFSNEAGVGSASIAHSAAKTDEPVSEGIVALLEPFIDTVVVCTMTALVIIITGNVNPEETQGVTLTSQAFASVISWFPYVLSLAVILFALSTMISWSYYGLKSWTYLFGESNGSEISYKLLFCIFIVIGSSMELTSVFGFSDAMIFAMAFPNVLGLYFLAPEVKKDLKEYLRKIKTGEIKRYF